jgi:hypothetical protein
MSRPILISPGNGSQVNSIPITFRWFPIQNSSTNGPVSNYTIEIDDDADFSSLIESHNTIYSDYTLSSTLAKGTYYWRVKAIYATPPGSTAGWSEIWNFTAEIPPTPIILTPNNNEHLSGIYNITATSDPDTVFVEFHYYDGSWNFIGDGNYDSIYDKWFCNWDTTGLNIVDISVSVIAEDDSGLSGESTKTGIEIDNTSPTPILLTPQTNEHISGAYNITATSDQDTYSIVFYYFDGNWNLIGNGNFDIINDKWYYNWNTSLLNLAGVIVSANATDEMGFWGNTTSSDIEIDNTIPSPILVTPQDNGNISGIYNLTAISDQDTESLKFYYYDGTWHLIGEGINVSEGDIWYYEWDTSDLDLAGVIISVNASDEVGYSGSDMKVGVEIDNTPPNIILLTPSTGEDITGICNITTICDNDTTSVNFSYYDDAWNFIDSAEYDPITGNWYCLWETSTLNLKNVTISACATGKSSGNYHRYRIRD